MVHLSAALVCALAGAISGWFVPRLIAVVPEPEPEPVAQPGAQPGTLTGEGAAAPPKRLYTDIAAEPGLAVRSVLVAALVAGALGGAVGWAWPLVYLLPFVPIGIALSVIDWHTRRLPTWYLAPMYPAMVLAVLLCATLTGGWDDLRRAALGWLAMGGFYLLTNLVSARLVGFGDVRLSGLLGMGLGYLGWGQLLVGMYVAFLAFGLPPLVLAVVRRDRAILRLRMPFGPAMLAGAALGVILGAPSVDWYLHRAGSGS